MVGVEFDVTIHGTGLGGSDRVLLRDKNKGACGTGEALADAVLLDGPGAGDNNTRSWRCLLTVETTYLVCLCPRMRRACADHAAFAVPAGRIRATGPGQIAVSGGDTVFYGFPVTLSLGGPHPDRSR